MRSTGYIFMPWLSFPPNSAPHHSLALISRCLYIFHAPLQRRYCRLLTLLRLICKMKNPYSDPDDRLPHVPDKFAQVNKEGYRDDPLEFPIAAGFQGVSQLSKNDQITNPNTVPSSSTPTWNGSGTSSLPGSIDSYHSHSTAISDIWTPGSSPSRQSSLCSEPERYPVPQSLISTTQEAPYTISPHNSLYDGLLSGPSASADLLYSHNQDSDAFSGQPSPEHGQLFALTD
jgi:hypothetical protein